MRSPTRSPPRIFQTTRRISPNRAFRTFSRRRPSRAPPPFFCPGKASGLSWISPFLGNRPRSTRSASARARSPGQERRQPNEQQGGTGELRTMQEARGAPPEGHHRQHQQSGHQNSPRPPLSASDTSRRHPIRRVFPIAAARARVGRAIARLFISCYILPV